MAVKKTTPRGGPGAKKPVAKIVAKAKPRPKKSNKVSTELYPLVVAKGIAKIGKDTASYYANKLTPKDKKQIVKGGPRPKMQRMAQPAKPKRMAQKGR